MYSMTCKKRNPNNVSLNKCTTIYIDKAATSQFFHFSSRIYPWRNPILSGLNSPQNSSTSCPNISPTPISSASVLSAPPGAPPSLRRYPSQTAVFPSFPTTASPTPPGGFTFPKGLSTPSNHPVMKLKVNPGSSNLNATIRPGCIWFIL